MSNNNSNNKTTTMYKTTNGIQKLPTGNYRIRKMINGVKYSANFTKRKDAVRYLTLLTEASVKQSINN